jgi:hypothetical protein
VLGYAVFQESEKSNRQTNEKQMKNKRQTSDKQATTNEEEKEEQEEKKERKKIVKRKGSYRKEVLPDYYSAEPIRVDLPLASSEEIETVKNLVNKKGQTKDNERRIHEEIE